MDLTNVLTYPALAHTEKQSWNVNVRFLFYETGLEDVLQECI